MRDLGDLSCARWIYKGPNPPAYRMIQEVFCDRDHAEKWVNAVHDAIRPVVGNAA